MTVGFDTENLVFVPEGEVLSVYDPYRWQVLRVDTRRSTVRLVPRAVQVLEREAERLVKELNRLRDVQREDVAEQRMRVNRFLADIKSAQSSRIDALLKPGPAGGEGWRWWVRLTDTPAESFFTEDYEEAAETPATGISRPVFGTCSMDLAIDGEVPFPGEGEAAAFEWITPREGIRAEPIPVDRPLPLVQEFCGYQGNSAAGNSVALDTRAIPIEEHLGCVPVRILGEGVYMTLYFSLTRGIGHRVLAPYPEPKHGRVMALLNKRGFDVADEGETWQIRRRGEDVLHVYYGLEGKESLSFPEVPPFILAVSAGGDTGPEARGALLDAVLERTPSSA